MENNENQNWPTRDAQTSNRGLVSADPKTRAEVARKGGEAVSRNREYMAAIGRQDGENSRGNEVRHGYEGAPGSAE
jgi:general stress protein YciG